MVNNNKGRGKKPGNVNFDESLLDPRLRSDTAERRAASGTAPAPPFAPPLPPNEGYARMGEEAADENMNLPESAYKSLDFIMTSPSIQDENERFWLIGLQTGIGLGIAGAREAVLNEMQWENTVFQRPIQSRPSDPSPYQMRMAIGQACLTGFDRRVAYRAANHFLSTSSELADIIVQNGLTSCLPETGFAVMGTSLFLTAEKVARCHENFQLLNGKQGSAVARPQPGFGMGNSVSTKQPVPLTTSFTTDGTHVGGIDMTRLTGPAGLLANTLRATYGVGGPGMPPNQLYESREFEPLPHVFRRAEGAHASAHVANDDQGSKTEQEEHIDTGKKTLNVKPTAGRRAKRVPTQGTRAVTQSTNSRGVNKAGRGTRGTRGASAGPVNRRGPTGTRIASTRNPSSQPGPSLVQTRGGRTASQPARQARKKK